MKHLNIKSNDGFLHLSDLPKNCIFNKKITGCGGTTIALKNEINYVIAVPTTELIVNKIKRTDSGVGVTTFKDGTSVEIFGLFGLFDYQTKKSFKEYLNKDGVKKIICTYDKLPKLKEYLNPAEYQLLVDEYHSLLKAYSYRYDAINGIFDCYKDYKSACFMSATPINSDFKPNALKDLEEIEAVWNDIDTLKVKLEYTNKPYVRAANIIKAYKTDGYISINGIKSYEAFFFINSVNDILKLIEYTDLQPEDVRIICANTDANQKKLGRFQIENSNCPNKKFTFLTCKSFEGVDYESDTALCFVISTASNIHTQASIDTDIPQIAGRIRTANNPFRKLIIHIFNNTYKDLNLDVTYNDMKQAVEDDLNAANAIVKLFNSIDDEKQRKMLIKSINNKYISTKKGKFVFYDTLPKLELYNYMVNQVIYKSGLSVKKAYESTGALTTDAEYNKEMANFDNVIKASKKLTFKDNYLKALEAKKDGNIFELERLCKEELIRDAIYKLTPEEIKSVRYTKKGVRELLLNKNSRLNNATKITKIIKDSITYNEFIKNDKLIAIINNAYRKLGIDKTAKASDIKQWFDIKESRKSINNVQYRGYYILREKLTFKI
jgi:hypothetical protein